MTDPITPRQAAMILMKASGIDNRDPSAAADELWAAALTEARVGFDDCMAAVTTHYAGSVDRVMPAHVIAIARKRAADRREAERNRLAIESGGPREGTLDPEYVKARIQEAVDNALAVRAAREAASDALATSGAYSRRPGTGTGDLSGSAGE